MSVIIKPIISEKANYLTDLRGDYSFLVNTKANKNLKIMISANCYKPKSGSKTKNTYNCFCSIV